MSKDVVVIGLIAAKGAGKDTLAGFLSGFGYQRLAFADALYAEAATAYSTSVEALQVRETKETHQAELAPAFCREPAFAEYCQQWIANKYQEIGLGSAFAAMSPREVLQLWGTWRRETVSPTYWLDRVGAQIKAMPEGSKVVVTDVRYANEASYLAGNGGVLVRVRNGAAEQVALLDTHPSETELRSSPCHLAVDNNGGLDDLKEGAEALAEKIWYILGRPDRESLLSNPSMTEILLDLHAA